MAREPLITLGHVSKTFPGVRALEDVGFAIGRGEVHALVGENGAGKSTLIKILAGSLQPDEGSEVVIEDQAVHNLTPMQSLRKGIVVIYQDFSMFPNLTVAENIVLSLQIGRRAHIVRWPEMTRIAREALAALGVDIDPLARLDSLSIAKQQLVAIARALACKAKLIIMDEPTATLSSSEVELLFGIIRGLKEQGIAILFVSHKLEEIFEVCETFTVLRDGKYIGTYDKSELDNDKLIQLMVGRKIDFTHQGAERFGEPLLEIHNLNKWGYYKDISLTLRRGEIIGITGLVGAGRTEMVQALCGLNIPDSGEILLNGEPVRLRSTADMIHNRIAYVPESRLTEGLVLQQSVENNITLNVLDSLRGGSPLVSPRAKHRAALQWIETLNVKPGYPDMAVQKLSGGNQQRVVIAKWLATDPQVLIIDEPTNGIDIGAKAEIHRLLRELAAKGIGILMVSSELMEILSISDTVLVMRRGRITGRFDGASATQEQLMNAAILGDAAG